VILPVQSDVSVTSFARTAAGATFTTVVTLRPSGRAAVRLIRRGSLLRVTRRGSYFIEICDIGDLLLLGS
jgi:hypothetical protein